MDQLGRCVLARSSAGRRCAVKRLVMSSMVFLVVRLGSGVEGQSVPEAGSYPVVAGAASGMRCVANQRVLASIDSSNPLPGM